MKIEFGIIELEFGKMNLEKIDELEKLELEFWYIVLQYII